MAADDRLARAGPQRLPLQLPRTHCLFPESVREPRRLSFSTSEWGSTGFEESPPIPVPLWWEDREDQMLR